MKQKILIVDDDADIREILTLILDAEGYDVIALDNGHEVLESVQAERPSVILLDVLLGDTDGRDICRMLKADITAGSIPVMIVSGTHGFFDPDAPGCGADDYLAKPFDMEVLINKVRKLAA